jgi:hypothetical protein
MQIEFDGKNSGSVEIIVKLLPTNWFSGQAKITVDVTSLWPEPLNKAN